MSSVFSQFEDPVCEFSRLNTPVELFSVQDSGLMGVSWVISKPFLKPVKTPVSGAGLQSDICGQTSFILSLFCFVLVFFPSYNKFFLMFGINASRYKQASDNRQVLLCLFIISTSSSSKFTFCLTE